MSSTSNETDPFRIIRGAAIEQKQTSSDEASTRNFVVLISYSPWGLEVRMVSG